MATGSMDIMGIASNVDMSEYEDTMALNDTASVEEAKLSNSNQRRL